MNIGETGGKGESLVASFLRKNGCAVIKRNYSCRFGEIDIISETDEYIIFTEVKTRAEDSLVAIEDAVSQAKTARLRATAQSFLAKYETKLKPRFDAALVTVYKRDDGTDGYKLKYIKNAF